MLSLPRLITALALAAGVCLAARGVTSAPRTVERWDVCELVLKGPADGNPFVDVRLSAVFTHGSRTLEVPGFYDGDGVYRIRFMPDESGVWRYETKSNRWALTGDTGQVAVTEARKGNHGPVRVSNTFHFAYADGMPYRQIGTTIYNWTDAPEEVQEQTLKTLAAAPFNKVRMLLTPQPNGYQRKFAPPRWPFAGQPKNWDLARPNPAYFQHYEQRIAQLRDLGIEADVILFNPYGKWGFECMMPEQDDRLVRYVVARFAAYRNVWWSLANEYDYVRTKTDADWDRIGRLVQQADPFDHLRSIHNSQRIYDHRQSWVTHVSLQNGSAVEDPGRAELYRDVYLKPIVYDEVKYEGNSPLRWGNLSGPEMVHRFWCGTVAGTYVGHGDYFVTVGDDAWTSFGGKLTGESAPRLAFLRRVLEEAPAEGIDPVDKWQDPRVGGRPGEYYLIYFGREQPTTWTFQLFKEGVADGMKFAVEILDTWAMTVTPVPGEFVAKKDGRYRFVDAAGRAVSLPGKPGLALRIRRLGGAAAGEKPSDEPL